MNLTNQELAGKIQHTYISTTATREDLLRHCRECVEYGFDAAMVGAHWVETARTALKGSKVKLASAVDFPSGTMTTTGRAAEARALAEAGCDQLDIMIQVGWLKSGLDQAFFEDLKAVVEAARPAAIKVMLELPLLTEDERERAIALSVKAGVAWVKNASSGAVGPATPEQMRYLRERVPASVRVKASGGIKTREHALALLAAGAELMGTSSGIAIVTGGAARSDAY